MTLKYIAITANCGNDALGAEATKAIKGQFDKDKELGFCVINCQEVYFEKNLLALKEEMGADYNVTLAGKMVTRTKEDSHVALGRTGIGSFIISKKELDVSTEATIEARRDAYKGKALFHVGPNFNKGGVITQCTIKGIEGQVKLELTSAHYDAQNLTKVHGDRLRISDKSAKSAAEITTFESLVNIMPDIRISGYDANTRNKMINDVPVNMWKDNGHELDGLKQVPLGGTRFSGESTYKTDDPDIATTPADGKRLGFTKGGMLDFVDIQDGSKAKPISTSCTIIADGDKTTERDHAVIISPVLTTPVFESSFDKVKNQMASMLEAAAPKLSENLRDLKNNPINEKMLVRVYQDFLSKEGLLNSELKLFIKKLKIANEVTPESNKKEEVGELFKNKIWFEKMELKDYSEKLLEVRQTHREDIKQVSALKKEITNDNRTRSNSVSSVDSDSSFSNSDTESTKSKWSISSAFSSKREALQSSQPQQESSSSKWFSIRSPSPSPSPSPKEQVIFTENPIHQAAREREKPIPSSAPSPVVEKPSSFASLKAFMRAIKPAKVEADPSLSERIMPKNAG